MFCQLLKSSLLFFAVIANAHTLDNPPLPAELQMPPPISIGQLDHILSYHNTTDLLHQYQARQREFV